jgi:NADH-quinone oxidoreductase subunit B
MNAMTALWDTRGEAPRPTAPSSWLRRLLGRATQPAVSWARARSLTGITFGGGCCGAHLEAAFGPHSGLYPYAPIVPAVAPEQADLLWVVGCVSHKQAPLLRQLWEQMQEPKWAIALGACAATGGAYDTYSTVQGADRVIPIDVYVPGCPPSVAQIHDGLRLLQDKIQAERGRAMP